jgi:hypothetical protein
MINPLWRLFFEDQPRDEKGRFAAAPGGEEAETPAGSHPLDKQFREAHVPAKPEAQRPVQGP